jgi:integrase
MNVLKILGSYVLQHELKRSSEAQMATVLKVFLNWIGVSDLPVEHFTAERISEFLLAKQREGKSSHYRRSLRNSLKALYRFAHDGAGSPIRPVKLESLEPESWTTEEIERLIAACDELSYRDRNWWRTFILVAYYSGLNACDIHRLEKRHIPANGCVAFARAKTGKRVFFGLPQEVVAAVYAVAPESGPIWELQTSQEAFRMRFNRLVRLAGIRPGTFKRIRKTSGTLVEVANPGQGHRHLGNEQAIFSQHYEDKRVTQNVPTMPAALRIG